MENNSNLVECDVLSEKEMNAVHTMQKGPDDHMPFENRPSDENGDANFLDMLERERRTNERNEAALQKNIFLQNENATSTDGTIISEGRKKNASYKDPDELINEKKIITDTSEEIITYSKYAPRSVLKAEANAGIEDFIEMLAEVISKSGMDHIVFLHDDGERIKKDPDEQVDKTYIRYKIVSRKPLRERKPTVRDDEIREIGVDRNEQRRVRISAQRFTSIIQFDILSVNYKQNTEDMNFLEDVIFSYLHYFKRRGIREIVFEAQKTDETLDVYRERFSVKSLQYLIETEKQYVSFEDIIDDFNFTSN